jgi:predicted DCC family thiol-disulfide oxidoreductase YuxK
MDQRSGQAEPHHLLLYDGECGFCHAAVRFVLAHDRRRAFRFAALHNRSGAALFVAQSLGWPWSMTNVFRVLPRPWRDAAYAVVARHRHRILGPAEACLLPGPEDRDRFLDAGEGAPR